MLLNLFYLFLIYLSILFIWFVINTVGYAFSLALKRPSIATGISGLSFIATTILRLALGLYMLWIGVSLLINGEFLWLVFYIFIGYSLLGWLLSIISFPFIFVPAYYMDKLENDAADRNLDTIVGVEYTDQGIKIRLARLFTGLYLLNLGSIFLSPNKDELYISHWTNYITRPFVWIISETVLVGFFYIIYYRLKHGRFFNENKKLTLEVIWKIAFYIYLVLGILIYIFLPVFFGFLPI